MTEMMKTYRVAFVSKEASHSVDLFYKYRAEQLPEEGEVIDVVRFLRGRRIRARVTHVDADYQPPIHATQIS